MSGAGEDKNISAFIQCDSASAGGKHIGKGGGIPQSRAIQSGGTPAEEVLRSCGFCGFVFFGKARVSARSVGTCACKLQETAKALVFLVRWEAGLEVLQEQMSSMEEKLHRF